MCNHCSNYKSHASVPSPSFREIRQVSASSGKIDESPRCSDAKGGCCSWRQSCCGGGCCAPMPPCGPSLPCCASAPEPTPPNRSRTTPTSLTMSTAIAVSLAEDSLRSSLCNRVPMCYGGDCGGPASESESRSSGVIEKKLCGNEIEPSTTSTIRESDR